MDLVIDANVLISALVKTKGFTYDLIFNNKIKLYAPEYLLEEIEKHKQEILEKSKLTEEDLELFLSLVSQQIEFVPKEEFNEFREKAEKISPDINDAEYFCLALRLSCAIWSNDKKLKEQNEVKIYSSEELLGVMR